MAKDHSQAERTGHRYSGYRTRRYNHHPKRPLARPHDCLALPRQEETRLAHHPCGISRCCRPRLFVFSLPHVIKHQRGHNIFPRPIISSTQEIKATLDQLAPSPRHPRHHRTRRFFVFIINIRPQNACFRLGTIVYRVCDSSSSPPLCVKRRVKRFTPFPAHRTH